jgi:hypothetical protein
MLTRCNSRPEISFREGDKRDNMYVLQLLSGLGLDRIFDIDASVLNKIVFSGERRGKARKTSPFLELASVFVCFLLKTDHLFAESEF